MVSPNMEQSPLSRRWSLKGMTILVTGGTQGIGRRIVEELAGLGASVYIYASRLASLDDCLQAWRESGWTVHGSVCDISSRAGRIRLMRDVSHHFHGKLDVLVNNIGVAHVKPNIHTTEDEFALIMSTHFEASYHLSELAHSLLKSSGKGRVVFISSVAGFVPVAIPCDLYATTKGAMTQLTASLARKWSCDGIRVNGVVPGVADHLIAEDIPNVEDRGDTKRARRGSLATSSGVSAAVAFLCMPCASFCQGEVLLVEADITMRPAFC